MKVILSKYAGFCFGVDNAIKTSESVLKKNEKKDIYMLGELVHNEEVVKKIKKQGIKLVKDITKIPKKSLIILSAHGHSPIVYKEAEKRKLEIVDATCPMVKKAHILGKSLAQKGYFVIIVGDKNHQEVKAIFDQVKTVTNKVKIIESQKQAKKINTSKDGINNAKKIGIISQTTQPLENFSEIVGEISKMADKLSVFNTICEATRFRQAYAKDLAQKVDLMIIVGSLHSANTKRLTQICKKIVKTYQINSSTELDKNWFKNKKTIGGSAGASTPDWIIDGVVEFVGKI